MNKWTPQEIKSLGKVITGKTPPTEIPEYYNGDELFVSPKDLEFDSTYINDTQTKTTKKALEKFKNQVIPRNAIMYTSLSYAFGKIGIANRNVITNQQIASVIANPQNHYRFIYYLLRINTSYIFTFNSGIDTPMVPKSVFEKIKLNVCQLPLQKKIAAILTTYDDLIEINKQRIATLEKTAEELYKEWFVRLRFPNFKEVPVNKGVPNGWDIGKVSDLGKTVTGKTPPMNQPRYYNGDYPFIKTPDMHDQMFISHTLETLSEDGLKSQKGQTIPPNSICVSCIGTGGVVAITSEISQTNQQIHSVVLNNLLYREWAYFTLKNLKETIELFGYTGSTMTNLSKGKFDNLKIIIPPQEIIYAFNKIIAHNFELILNLQKSIAINIQTRDQILTRLMSGKIDVEKLDIKFPPSMLEEEVSNA